MHILSSFDIGGLENGVVNLLNTMDRDRFTHAICCIDRSGRSAEKLTRGDIEIFEMKKGDGRDLFLPFKLARLFKNFNPDIVHTRNWGAIDGILGARLAGVPVVIHGEHGRDITDPDGESIKRILIRRYLSYFVDCYVTVSKDLEKWLTLVVGIPEKKVQTICNGVDTLKFNPEGRDLVRARYGYSDKDLVIGTVGRLDPIKDQQLLIKAFAQLHGKYPNLTLLIIGDGPCRGDLEKLTEHLGIQRSVRFLGLRMDVPELLKLLDIFVLPSLREGIPNTVLEAMATALPVIATSVGGNIELVDHEETGYLIPREYVSALANTLEKYILDRPTMKRHGIAGRERAVKEFSLDKMAVHYEALYTQLLTKK